MARIAIIHFTNYPKGQTRGCMAAVMKYTMQVKKTLWNGRQLVSGVNCRPESVCDDFLRTKLLYHKDGGTMFYHMVQSFPAGENVDPTAAHAAALKLAEWFEDREVLVCTHVDRDHIHSHFIVNSVSLEDGRKLHLSAPELEALRRRNDQVCMEFGLPVFQPQKKEKVKSMSGSEYHAAARGESWKFRLMNTIDECMKYAHSREEFVTLMRNEGYDVRWTDSRKNITYTTPEGKKCRDDRLHEEKYLKEVMEHEFTIRARLIAGGAESPQPAGEYAAAGPSHGGGVDRASGNAQCTVPTDRRTVRSEHEPRPQAAGSGRAGAGSDREGRGGDPNTSGAGAPEERTGWEEERTALFLSMAESQSPSSVPGLAVSAHDFGRVVGAVAQLGHTLERDQSPVIVTHSHSDRKVLRRERELKIAMGHRPDDHEERQGPTFSL